MSHFFHLSLSIWYLLFRLCLDQIEKVNGKVFHTQLLTMFLQERFQASFIKEFHISKYRTEAYRNRPEANLLAENPGEKSYSPDVIFQSSMEVDKLLQTHTNLRFLEIDTLKAGICITHLKVYEIKDHFASLSAAATQFDKLLLTFTKQLQITNYCIKRLYQSCKGLSNFDKFVNLAKNTLLWQTFVPTSFLKHKSLFVRVCKKQVNVLQINSKRIST